MRWSLFGFVVGGVVVAVVPVVFPAWRFLPLVLAIMLVALRRSRLAWALVLASALLQEWVSLLPSGTHMVEAAAVVLVATAALRRVVSTSTWAQLGLACFVTLAAAEFALAGWVIGIHALSPAANTPLWSVFARMTFQQALAATAITMIAWPAVRARFAPLHRVHYER